MLWKSIRSEKISTLHPEPVSCLFANIKRHFISYFMGIREEALESSRECYVKIVKTRSRFASSLGRLDFSSLESVAMHESEASRRRIFKDRRWPHQVKWKFSGLLRFGSQPVAAEIAETKKSMVSFGVVSGNTRDPMTLRPWLVPCTFQSFSFSVNSLRSYYCKKFAIKCKDFLLLNFFLHLIINIYSFGNIVFIQYCYIFKSLHSRNI